MKSIIAGFAAVILFIGLLLPQGQGAQAASVTYSDIDKHWAKDTILAMASQGYVAGYEDGTFRPDAPVTRAEWVTLVNKVIGYEQESKEVFTDVPADSWYSKEVSKASQAGYISGYPGNLFKPDAPIRRSETAAVLTKLTQYRVDGTDSADSFTDVKQAAAWVKGAVAVAAEHNLMQGQGQAFWPNGSLTRAEAVVILSRLTQQIQIYHKPGTYGPEQVATKLKQDVLIDVDGVHLQNVQIEGDLILGAHVGEGDVKLTNVTVKGTTYVYGGGVNSIHFKGAKIGHLIVDKSTPVRLTFSHSSVTRITARTKAIIVNLDDSKLGKQEGAIETQEGPPSPTPSPKPTVTPTPSPGGGSGGNGGGGGTGSTPTPTPSATPYDIGLTAEAYFYEGYFNIDTQVVNFGEDVDGLKYGVKLEVEGIEGDDILAVDSDPDSEEEFELHRVAGTDTFVGYYGGEAGVSMDTESWENHWTIFGLTLDDVREHPQIGFTVWLAPKGSPGEEHAIVSAEGIHELTEGEVMLDIWTEYPTIEDGVIRVAGQAVNLKLQEYEDTTAGLYVYLEGVEGDSLTVTYGDGEETSLARIGDTDEFTGYLDQVGSSLSYGYNSQFELNIQAGDAADVVQLGLVELWIGEGDTPSLDDALASDYIDLDINKLDLNIGEPQVVGRTIDFPVTVVNSDGESYEYARYAVYLYAEGVVGNELTVTDETGKELAVLTRQDDSDLFLGYIGDEAGTPIEPGTSTFTVRTNLSGQPDVDYVALLLVLGQAPEPDSPYLTGIIDSVEVELD
ncbi:S-layer homology domain-containing protein [Paenibacillus sp. GCM10023252]|uniref:S-layer homology domain-containing protein n=1 Tax=Paenibacillus sp. GCM10023252 TaxID=3252649 RepID=UPI00361AD4A8